ncbi:MAG: efflux RND transporter periplasmic adaptor subunit [Cognatishimia sp.]
MRFLRQSMVGLFLLSVTVGLLTIAAQMFTGALAERLSDATPARQQRERVFTVNVLTATPEEVVPQISVFGEVQSQRTLELRASAGGTIVEMVPDFREGGQVQAGQILVQVDTSDAQDSLARAASEVRASQADVRDAARALSLASDELMAASDQVDLRAKALSRQQDLESRGVGTAAAVETAELSLSAAKQQELSRRQAIAQAETRVDQSATRLERANIALAEAERQLSDLQVVADFDGKLADVNAVKGGLVSANERLAQLIDPNALEVTFRVSTAQYTRLIDESGRLRPADVSVSLNVFGLVLEAQGRISRDSAAVGEGQTGRLIFATLENARGLKPGDFVSVAIKELPIRNVVRLPAAAVDPHGQVMVVGEDSRLEALPISLIRRQGDEVLVEGTHLAGKAIVTRLTPLLGTGIRVKPVQENTSGSPIVAASSEPELLELTEERRARLVAFVEGNRRMPADRKQRVLDQLSQQKVPAQVVNRLEQRIGG